MNRVSMTAMKSLPTETVDRMCASQVIPNVHSCVRELIENALDAQANSISIRVRNSGMELEVADDGCGVNEEDWPNLCKPHNTSKISKYDDLYSACISSHGFRGEALAALCSLSNQLRVVTRSLGTDTGRILVYDNKCILSMSEERISKSVGTTVTVVGLFENSIPVRFLESQKNLKKEFKLIINLVHELAMIHPRRKFEFLLDGKCMVSSPGSLSNCYQVYQRVLNGGNLADFDIPKEGNVKLSGWITPPMRADDNMSVYQFVYLNSRPINSIKRLTKSVLSIFSKYNIKRVSWIILIQIDTPNLFDVNISVDKREILFVPETEKLIVDLIQNQLAKMFSEKTVSPAVEFRSSTLKRGFDLINVDVSKDALKPLIDDVADEVMADEICPSSKRDDTEEIMEISLKFDKNMFTMMELIGQFNNGFIVTKINGELFLVDQHAANEKYLFEYYNDNILIKPQILIAPIKLKVNPMLEDIIHENKEELFRCGFRTEYISTNPRGQRFQINTLPTLSGIGFNRSAALSINDFMQLLDALDSETQIAPGNHALLRLLPSVKNMFASKACRTAVMVGDCLTDTRMMEIVHSLATLHQPWNCPHGRPTLKHLLSLSDIEKM